MRGALAVIMEFRNDELCSYSGSGEGSRKLGAANEEECEEVGPTCDSNKSCVFRTAKDRGRRYVKKEGAICQRCDLVVKHRVGKCVKVYACGVCGAVFCSARCKNT